MLKFPKKGGHSPFNHLYCKFYPIYPTKAAQKSTFSSFWYCQVSKVLQFYFVENSVVYQPLMQRYSSSVAPKRQDYEISRESPVSKTVKKVSRAF